MRGSAGEVEAGQSARVVDVHTKQWIREGRKGCLGTGKSRYDGMGKKRKERSKMERAKKKRKGGGEWKGRSNGEASARKKTSWEAKPPAGRD
ncbi:uncharacterized protein SPSK_02082 [Sporothrix schenckii 1099-18]|uniref:Uncharacterized protein n=1 Tax=Sporothrix schenckii 1099-18 TaxID=1397361 RepID=A0A0F2MDD2_SPOSC|nr:uncharacterized protein SPSK_02082 [Sporothrix schenckii 1099-18]KJR87089.1 hypothetical protein SPSK_02082 [Sporothrix schenckii 1099-18]